MNKRVFFISEPSVRISIGKGGELKWEIDDLLTNTALDFDGSCTPSFIGRVSADVTGRLIMDRLESRVDTRGVDVYSDVPVPLTVTAESGASRPALYSIPSAEAFNPVWPRFEEGDMVVWGGYFSVDKSVHPRLIELLKYASARKTRMVYVPYFTELQVPRVTRVMPEIFDNLELAQTVVATTGVMDRLFDSPDLKSMYHDHVKFYAPGFYALDGTADRYDVAFASDGKTYPSGITLADLLKSLS